MHPIGITGVGIVTGAGMGLREHMERLERNELVGPIPLSPSIYGFDPSEAPGSFRTTTGTCVHSVFGVPHQTAELAQHFPKGGRYDRYQLFAMIAAHEALSNSVHGKVGENMGYYIGTGGAGTAEASTAQARIERNLQVGPFALMRFLPGMTTGLIAQAYGIQGFGAVFSRGCVASADAIGHALDQISLGRIDTALCGGAEAPITPISIAAFCGTRVLGDASTPYSIGRNGLIPGEGAAMLMLKKAEHAKDDGVTPLAEIIGYSSGIQWLEPNVAFTDIASQGVTRAIETALSSADIVPADVEHVFTHATGTIQGDPMELKGIVDAWGGAKLPTISSVKSFTGHTFGASGAVSLALAVGALQYGVIPHTQGLEVSTIDPACAGFGFHFPTRAEKRAINVCMVLSHGFGGAYTCFILRRT